MAFRNILLAYSGEAAFLSSLRHALKIARQHDGWLTGVFRNGPSYIDRYGAGLSTDLRARLEAVENEDMAAAMALFHEEAALAGLSERVAFLDPEEVGTLPPSEIARAYDLVVTGAQSHLPNEEHRAASPDMLALRSGRPVLIVPDGYSAPGLADHALVAWDGKRSAARALNDAMAIFEVDRRRVTVLTVGPEPELPPPGGGIVTHLQRHDVQAIHLHKRPRHQSIAQLIETTARDLGAKLIVMGAYEHSKFSQDMFGGVTHEVMRTARVPVLMSH